MNPFSQAFSHSVLSLRRRSVWEAVDSGLLLWRSSFIHFIPFFALPVWIAACALRLLPFTYLSYLVLWWLKPLFDRLVLHVVSIRFFGSPAPSRFRELRRFFWGNLGRGLLGDLLWRRFSPGRAARMPIRVLERMGGKQFRRRKRALVPGGLNFCYLLSVLGLAMEAMLLFGEIVFVMMVAQMFFPSALGYMRDNMETMEIFIFAAFCLNFILVESLYVCMGFGLYINSRVEVEGWDLQLLFHKLAEGNRRPFAGPAAVLFLCLFLALTPAAHAEPVEPAEETELVMEESEEKPVEYFPEDFPFAGKGSQEALAEILASPDFGSQKEGWGIRFRERFPERPEMPELDFDPWVKVMEKIRQVFSFALRFLLIIAIAGFAIFAFYWLWKNQRNSFRRKGGGGRSYANPLLSGESPETLFARAEDFFNQGKLREAWAACLAGCLGVYTRYRSLSFPIETTEYGCLEMVRRALPAEAGGFGDLVQSWILLAYGGRAPGKGAFEQALAYGRSLLEGSNEP